MAYHSYFSHTSRDGSGVAERASRAGYPWRAIGENIAAGQMNAEVEVQSWVKSPGYRANLMMPVYTDMGAAFAMNERSSAGIYWVQRFGAARWRLLARQRRTMRKFLRLMSKCRI